MEARDMPILEAIAEAKRNREHVIEIDEDRMNPFLWYALERAGFTLEYLITCTGPVVVCSWD